MLALGLLLATPAGATPEDIHQHPTAITDEELFASLDLDRPGLEAVKAAAEAGDYAAAATAWAAYWRQRERPVLIFDRADWPGWIREHRPAIGEALIEKADLVVAGDINHATIRFPVDGREINWLHNPDRDSNYVSLAGSYWFMWPVGRAYLLTADERYPEAFAWVFESWYDHQPQMTEFRGGINIDPLFHAYYPGIRARVLCDNYYCLARSPALTPQVHVKVLKAILAAASWLHADNGGYKIGNQQIAAVMGAVVAGMFLPEFRQSGAWVERGIQRMREHLEQDFFPDGAHRELCTQYHKTILRDMGWVALQAQRNGLPGFFDADDPSHAAFERVYDWLARIVMPSGLTPPLHSAVFANDYAVHLGIASEQFGRPDFAWLANQVWQKGIVPSQKGPFALGNYLVCEARESGAVEPAPPEYLSLHLPDSGIAIMRTGWMPGESYLIFQYGWANTSHAYPGALHFCLEMNGEVVATSPGSGLSYALPSYRYCHSTPSHNVVSIDGASYTGKNGIAPGGTLHEYADEGEVWYVRASHEGYREQLGAVHGREIVALQDGPILIRDVIAGGEGHTAQWNFHTPLQVEPAGPGRVTLKGRSAYTLALADPETLSEPKIELHWSAVPPDLCQPVDCGKDVPAITFERPLGPEGAEFVAAIIEGDGTTENQGNGQYRVAWDGGACTVTFTAGGGCTVRREGGADAVAVE